MDSGCFYSRGDSLLRPQGMGLGFQPIGRQIYAPEDSALNREYPEMHVSEVGLGQKIDQIVYLVREQAKETAMIKEELCSLRANMQELQDTNTRLSESVSSTPTSLSGSSTSGSTHKKSKIPTQLSVRKPVAILNSSPFLWCVHFATGSGQNST